MKRVAGRLEVRVKQKRCRHCAKMYLPKSTIGKYCSPQCLRAATPQRTVVRKFVSRPLSRPSVKNVQAQCVVCATVFITVQGIARQKVCSSACRMARERAKREQHAGESVRCRRCDKAYLRSSVQTGKTCLACTSAQRVRAARVPKKRSKTTATHIRACVEYKKAYLDKHSYLSCEVCHVNQAFKFEVHHIYYASKFPRHPNLHNEKNLILICNDCHTRFHADQLTAVFAKLEAERGLKKLFAKTE